MARTIEHLQLSDIHSAGKAVGFRGKNIFVPFGIPGETVTVTLDRRQRGFYSGSIQRIECSSPERISPFCSHHGLCGGCNWQHMNYGEQLSLKKRILENALRKYQIETPPVPDVIPSPETHFFRNKVEYAFSSTILTSDGQSYPQNSLGFHPIERRDQVLEIHHCWLQKEPSRKICETAVRIAYKHRLSFYNYQSKTGLLRNLVIRTSSMGECLVIMGTTSQAEELIRPFLIELKQEVPEISSLLYTVLSSAEKGYADGEMNVVYGPGYLTEKMDDLVYRVSPKAFFQPNSAQALNIYRKVKEFAHLKGNEFVYDLYTGAGTIAGYVARNAGKVVGIEGSADAIEDARFNASVNGLTNTEFIFGDVLETFRPEFVARYNKPDMVILDPPRSGTLIEIKKTITGAAPSRIIYVSCNPVSLAFDLTMLTSGYRVAEIQPFDMFPHTHHVETVVLLEKI